MNELATAIYLQAGYEKYLVVVAMAAKRGIKITPSHATRHAFLAGAMHGQYWSGPASARLGNW